MKNKKNIRVSFMNVPLSKEKRGIRVRGQNSDGMERREGMERKSKNRG